MSSSDTANYELLQKTKQEINQNIDSIKVNIIGFDTTIECIKISINDFSNTFIHFIECSPSVTHLNSKLDLLLKIREHYVFLLRLISLPPTTNQRIPTMCFISNVIVQFYIRSEYFDDEINEYFRNQINKFVIPKSKSIDENLIINCKNEIKTNQKKINDNHIQIRILRDELFYSKCEIAKEILKNQINLVHEDNNRLDKENIKLRQTIKSTTMSKYSLEEVEEITKDFFEKLFASNYKEGKGKIKFQNHDKYLKRSYDQYESFYGVNNHAILNNPILTACFDILEIDWSFEKVIRRLEDVQECEYEPDMSGFGGRYGDLRWVKNPKDTYYA